MSSFPKLRSGSPAGILVGLAGLAGLAWAGWWFLREARALYIGMDRSLAAGVLTALACTSLVVLAIRRAGAPRGARLRCRAQAYEAVLGAILSNALLNESDWHPVRARLVLWGSRTVIGKFQSLQRRGLLLDLKHPEVSAELAELVRAMRRDLGQTNAGIDIGALLGQGSSNKPLGSEGSAHLPNQTSSETHHHQQKTYETNRKNLLPKT